MRIRFVQEFMGSPCPQYSSLYAAGRECDVPSNEMPDELAADALARGFAVVVTDSDDHEVEHAAEIDKAEAPKRRRKK